MYIYSHIYIYMLFVDLFSAFASSMNFSMCSIHMDDISPALVIKLQLRHGPPTFEA